MDDSAPQQTPKRRLHWHKPALFLAIAIALFALTEYFASYYLRSNPRTLEVPVSIIALLAATALLLIGGAVVHFITAWKRLARNLARAIPPIRAGEEPIESLPDAAALTPLAQTIRDLLIDLRKQRADIARLELEMSQRVANRTDALERRLGSLRTQATRDALTGLFNRRMLDESAEDLVARCVDEHSQVCAIMMDLDDFKLMNDKMGHAAGDELLRAVAQLIRSSIRDIDLAFRCGGDEFLILMPGQGKSAGQALAKRIGDLVDELTKPLRLTRRPRMSAGIATLLDITPSTSAHDLLECADRHLYGAKAGRKGQAA